MTSHNNHYTAQARRNIGPESAGYPSPITKVKQQANALRRSEITNFHVSSALECLAHAIEARLRQDFTRGDRCPRLHEGLHAPPNGFHSEEPEGNWVLVFLFFRPRVRGSQGTTEADWGHSSWGQTRFGYARSKRSQPQFKAHNSVRPFETGLSLRGSSATRPARVRLAVICPSTRANCPSDSTYYEHRNFGELLKLL